MGARSVRTRRIAEAMPIVARLREHEAECDSARLTRHISREDRARWLVTPISRSVREDDAIADSNWDVAWERLLAASSYGELDTRDDAWPGGVIETILIRADDAPALRELERILAELADYPLLDEEHWSALEWERNHPSPTECYGDDDCPCELRNHEHPAGMPGDRYGNGWCELCRDYVRVGTVVGHPR